MANVALVLKNNHLLIPPFDKTLAGTTALRVIEYANDVLIPQGLLKGLRREHIKVYDAKRESKEVMLLGGNACVPVLQWDDTKISSEPGPIAKNLQHFFAEVLFAASLGRLQNDLGRSPTRSLRHR